MCLNECVAAAQVYNSGQGGGRGGLARRVDGGVGGRRVRGRARARLRRRLPAARRRLLGPAALRAHAQAEAQPLLVCTASSAPRRGYVDDWTSQTDEDIHNLNRSRYSLYLLVHI